MRIDHPRLLRDALIAARREWARRQAAEQAVNEEAKERLLAEFAEMGRRFVAVRVPGRDL